MRDIRVVSDGPLYERLLAAWHLERDPGYISAQVLFLASPSKMTTYRGAVVIPAGVWYFPILVGWLLAGSQEERAALLAPRLLDAVLRFIEELEMGEPDFLEVPGLDELWTGKPLRDAPRREP